jgi:AmmeMemoRadiSam system protein B
MRDPLQRPALRPVESIVVPDPDHGRVLVLRDGHGITDAQAVLPPALVPIVALFDGRHSVGEIAAQASRELGEEVPVEAVKRLVLELDRGLFLDSPRYHDAKKAIEDGFRKSAVRPSAHAGGAYHDDPAALREYIETECFAPVRSKKRNGKGAGRVVGLIAPHIDPWRGARCYGHAYDALREALPEEADTFVLLGTSHAPMREPFALCRKGFHTPFGLLEADHHAIDRLASAASFDPFADELNHKREHSLEFQAVFLKHLLNGRPARIVPVLAGLGRHQADGSSPAAHPGTKKFLDELRALVGERNGRAVVVAGADMAHVGPRFGDAAPYDGAARKKLETRDRESLERAAAGDDEGFWAHVAEDLETRRVCGLAPVYSLLRALPSGTRGSVLHYEQTVDPEEGSIVSHAAVVFHA